MLHIITPLATSFLGMSTSMTLNNLESPKSGVLMNYSWFRAAMCISRVKPAHKFLALNVDFSSLNLDPLGSRRPAHTVSKRDTPLKSGYLFVVHGLSITWKWLQIGTDMLLIITHTGDELLRNVNVDDLEWLQTLKLRFLVIFGNFWLQKKIATKWTELVQYYLRTETAIGSRASHEQ